LYREKEHTRVLKYTNVLFASYAKQG